MLARSNHFRWLIRVGVAASFVQAGFALNPQLVLSQYLHTSWTSRGGFVINSVTALAQTRDGYLWLGNDGGAIRFNGIGFVPGAASPKETKADAGITSLFASADGSLWIGMTNRLRRQEGATSKTYTISDGLPEGIVVQMAEDHSGAVWAAITRNGANVLAMISKETVKTYGAANGVPGGTALSLSVDRLGQLWVGSSSGLCRFSGERVSDCVLSRPPTAILAIQSDASGNLFYLDGIARAVGSLNGTTAQLAATVPLGTTATTLLLDRDGNLWAGTLGQGLLRLRNGKVERFTQRDGLSSDAVSSLLEDREGNLWVGTAGGLDRLREPKVTRWSTTEGLGGNLCTAVCAARDGSVWVGFTGGGLNHLRNSQITHESRDPVLPDKTVWSLYEDAAGSLWAGTSTRLLHVSRGSVREVHGPGNTSLDRVFSITGGKDGTVWAADSRAGLLRIRGSSVESPRWNMSGPGRDIYQLHAASSGALWVGYYQGGVTERNNDSERFYLPRDGLAAGPVQSIEEDEAGNIWVATTEGLTRIRQGKLTTWGSELGVPKGGIQSLLDDRAGRLWLTSRDGLLYLSGEDLASTPDGTPKPLSVRTFVPSSGIRIPPIRGMVGPRMARSTDGKLWISTQDGLAAVEPERTRRNVVPPPVTIESVTVDGRPVNIGRVSIRGQKLQVEFAALSLTSPEAVLYRYKLEGVDRNWSSARGERSIAYASVPPGEYRFRVIAANEDGVWNYAGAGFIVDSQPFFYQTWSFITLCAATLGLLAYGTHLLRIRSIQRRFEAVLQERTRVARDLHDGLLQGFVGVTYLLEAASREAEGTPERSRERLERATQQADQSLRDAREALSDMRLSVLDQGLAKAISNAGKEVVSDTEIRFRSEVAGLPSELRYDVQVQLYYIAREAITNAMNHANPRQIHVKLTYGEREVRLQVRDDGSGFDSQAGFAREKHFGLIGMQERARRIGAQFLLSSELGRGTSIEVITARESYRSHPAHA